MQGLIVHLALRRHAINQVRQQLRQLAGGAIHVGAQLLRQRLHRLFAERRLQLPAADRLVAAGADP